MGLAVTFVGTGAAAPSATRVQAATLVAAADVRLLLDCGAGAVHRLASLGLDWRGITHVALTHFHADHVSDLAALFTAWRYGQLPPRTRPLVIAGPPGTLALLRRIADALGTDVTAYGFPVTLVEQPRRSAWRLAPDVLLASHPVLHTPESVAYAVTHAGRRLVLSGDTSYDEDFAAWAAECDTLVLECSLPQELAVPTHLTPDDVGRLAARARPHRLVCTHLYPPVEAVDIPSIVGARWSGPVTVAHDGLTVAL